MRAAIASVRMLAGLAVDGLLVVLLVVLLPVGIILIGTPVVLAIRLLVEIARRW